MTAFTDFEIQEAVTAFERLGSKSEAAIALGISRDAIRRRLIAATTREKPSPFQAPTLPSPDVPLDELLDRRRKTAARVMAADNARDLIQVPIKIKGVFGLFLMGDPHLDSEGGDFVALERDINLIEGNPAIASISIGDVTDNWVGRLERQYAASSTTAKDAWRLAEWLFSRKCNWLALVQGNHDAWSGHRDPLKWITKARVPLYEPGSTRLALKHPNSVITRVHARHDFPGRSMYSDTHGMRRQLREGLRDHLLVAGHLHSGEDGAVVNGDGFISQFVRLSGYKKADSYARELGFQKRPMHASALAIINPDAPETERGRVWLAPSIGEGVEWLNWKRRRAA